jgi:TadE-like protein
MLSRFLSLARHNKRGVTTIEIAVAMPVLMLLFLGGYEAWRFVGARSKAETAAHVLADLVSQSDTAVTEAEVTSLLRSVELIIRPYQLATQARAVVSTVAVGSPSSILWQRCRGGASFTSRLGAAGGTPSFTAARLQNPPAGSTVIVSEVAIEFRPVFLGNLFPARQFRSSSILRARLRAPVTVNPGGTASGC